MKQTPYDKQLAANLARGALCRDGFLGTDHREVWEIVAADNAAVSRLGLTHGRIADRLRDILERAMARYGNPADVGEGLTAVYREAMGRIPCPWPHCTLAPKGEVELSDEAGRTLLFSPLSVHLIAEHGFYQGRGSRYRLEPKDLAAVLGLAQEGCRANSSHCIKGRYNNSGPSS